MVFLSFTTCPVSGLSGFLHGIWLSTWAGSNQITFWMNLNLMLLLEGIFLDSLPLDVHIFHRYDPSAYLTATCTYLRYISLLEDGPWYQGQIAPLLSRRSGFASWKQHLFWRNNSVRLTLPRSRISGCLMHRTNFLYFLAVYEECMISLHLYKNRGTSIS